MIEDVNQCCCTISRNYGMDYIVSVLESNSLPLREKKILANGMMTAQQPLYVGAEEICTDSLFIEVAAYRTAEEMARETETLTLKKRAYSAFESSLTPIPKYCFKNPGDLTAILVCSAPAFSLDDILTVCEKKYPKPYTYRPFLFYSDWIAAIMKRVGNNSRTGKLSRIKTAFTAFRYLFPPPPHISRKERTAFVNLILQTARLHHKNGIFHDCISEKTIFFPTSNQPMFLSNYSGVPSCMLSDILPTELMTDKATADYGPQCRDVYCLTLVCYRIMTGESLDGKRFSLDSPRPIRTVIGEIVRNNGLSFSFSDFSSLKKTVVSIGKTAATIVNLLRLAFSEKAFQPWRKINRATGGLWRTFPLIGPLSDILYPTPCAQTLRYVLDKAWFLDYCSRRSLSTSPVSRKWPDISFLAKAFKTRRPFFYRSFESAFYELISESAIKRKAFGSIMESKSVVRKPWRIVSAAGSAAGAAIMAIIILTIKNHLALDDKTGSIPDTASLLSASYDRSANRGSEDSAGTPYNPPAQTASQDKGGYTSKTTNRENITLLSKRSPIPVVPGKSVYSSRSEEPKKKKRAIVSKTTSKTKEKNNDITFPAVIDSEKTIPPKPHREKKRLLYPLATHQGVYIVSEVTDSCNPGKLYYIRNGRPDSVMISRLSDAAVKLYLSHLASQGFSQIETVRLCRSSDCDKTMYYKSFGIGGKGKPAYVKTGDAISTDREKLENFIKSKIKK